MRGQSSLQAARQSPTGLSSTTRRWRRREGDWKARRSRSWVTLPSDQGSSRRPRNTTPAPWCSTIRWSLFTFQHANQFSDESGQTDQHTNNKREICVLEYLGHKNVMIYYIFGMQKKKNPASRNAWSIQYSQLNLKLNFLELSPLYQQSSGKTQIT